MRRSLLFLERLSHFHYLALFSFFPKISPQREVPDLPERSPSSPSVLLCHSVCLRCFEFSLFAHIFTFAPRTNTVCFSLLKNSHQPVFWLSVVNSICIVWYVELFMGTETINSKSCYNLSSQSFPPSNSIMYLYIRCTTIICQTVYHTLLVTNFLAASAKNID